MGAVAFLGGSKSIRAKEVVGLALTQDIARGLISLDLISIDIEDGQGPITEGKALRNVEGVKRQDAILHGIGHLPDVAHMPSIFAHIGSVYGVIESDGELDALAVVTGHRPEIDGGSGMR